MRLTGITCMRSGRPCGAGAQYTLWVIGCAKACSVHPTYVARAPVRHPWTTHPRVHCTVWVALSCVPHASSLDTSHCECEKMRQCGGAVRFPYPPSRNDT